MGSPECKTFTIGSTHTATSVWPSCRSCCASPASAPRALVWTSARPCSSARCSTTAWPIRASCPCPMHPPSSTPPQRAADPEAKTLLCYGHYDVQPPEPLELWVDPPFSAAIRDGVIYARGATDNKSGVLAFVRAAQAFREVRGGVPVNLTFFFEGEEEVGSPHLAALGGRPQGALRLRRQHRAGRRRPSHLLQAGDPSGHQGDPGRRTARQEPRHRLLERARAVAAGPERVVAPRPLPRAPSSAPTAASSSTAGTTICCRRTPMTSTICGKSWSTLTAQNWRASLG